MAIICFSCALHPLSPPRLAVEIFIGWPSWSRASLLGCLAPGWDPACAALSLLPLLHSHSYSIDLIQSITSNGRAAGLSYHEYSSLCRPYSVSSTPSKCPPRRLQLFAMLASPCVDSPIAVQILPGVTGNSFAAARTHSPPAASLVAH